jgi:hypothetical protein
MCCSKNKWRCQHREWAQPLRSSSRTRLLQQKIGREHSSQGVVLRRPIIGRMFKLIERNALGMTFGRVLARIFGYGLPNQDLGRRLRLAGQKVSSIADRVYSRESEPLVWKDVYRAAKAPARKNARGATEHNPAAQLHLCFVYNDASQSSRLWCALQASFIHS